MYFVEVDLKNDNFSCISAKAVTFFANMDLMNHKINNP
jgi:hypothetical protein